MGTIRYHFPEEHTDTNSALNEEGRDIFVVASRNVCFWSPLKGVRLPVRKIIAVQPYANGIQIMRDGVNAVPLAGLSYPPSRPEHSSKNESDSTAQEQQLPSSDRALNRDRIRSFADALLPKAPPIALIYDCPLHLQHGIGHYRRDDPWRKPAPGMIIQAAVDLNLDLAQSVIVGNKLSDMEAGARARVGLRILVRNSAREPGSGPSDPKIAADLTGCLHCCAGISPRDQLIRNSAIRRCAAHV